MNQLTFFEGLESSQPAEAAVDPVRIASQIASAAAHRPEVTTPVSEAREDLGYGDSPEKPTTEELFRKKFDWVPRSKGEMRPALHGLEHTLEETDRYGGLAGIEKLIEKVEAYRNGSARDMAFLREAFVVPNERGSLSASAIRSKSDIIQLLARHQLFSSALDSGKWPGHQKGNIDKHLHPLELNLYGAGDEVLLELWVQAFDSVSYRNRFWGEEIRKVQSHPRVEEARAERLQRMR